MTKETRSTLTTLFDADPSISTQQKLAVFAVLENGCPSGHADRALTRGEVAKMLNIHPQTVSLYAKRGFIRKICCGTIGKRASRYSAQSISALLAGDKERI